MAHLQGWLSAEKPSVVQSPSLTAAAEIRGRLNFSSVKTPPTAVRRLPYNEINTMSNVGNRLGDYHMSKQNPAVIDQLYSPHKSSLYKTASPLFNGLSHSGHLNGNRSGRTQIQTFLRQTLNRRNSLPGGGTGTSLVHLAIQGRQRKYDSVPVSPVIVRLSGSSLTGNNKGAELGSLDEEETTVNPCDKDVVVSALRQKRKRWPTAYDDTSVSDIFPSAKRSRHSTHPQDGPASPSYMSYSRQLPERKRTNPTPAASQALKRTKVARPSSTVTSSTSSTHKENLFNRLRVPDIEYESDGESTGGVGPDDSEPKSVENGDTESVASGRSNTPILPEEDDAEIKKKREESLKLQRSLTTVFPSSLSRKSSSRRKLPVFCATGSKPHLPVPLSLTHSATPEDLKKDREAAAAKLKNFLSDEDEESKKKELEKKAEAQMPASTSQPTQPVLPATSAVLPTLTAPTSLPAPSSSTASLSSGTQIPGSLQLGKDVQPAAAVSAAVAQSSAPSLPASSTSLPGDKTAASSLQNLLSSAKPSSQLANSSSLTSLTAITTSASRDAPIMSTSQSGLSTRLPGLTGSLPSLQFKAPEQTSSSAPKSVSFMLPASTSSSSQSIATSVQGSLMAGAQLQPGLSTSQPQPTGGLQFSSMGLSVNSGLVAPGLTASSSAMATKNTAANSVRTFNFSAAPLQSSAPTSSSSSSSTASSTASLAAQQQQQVQRAPGLTLSGGLQLASQNTSQSGAGSTGTGGLFQKTATLTAAPAFSLTGITQQSAGGVFSQNKPTLTSSAANQFQGLQMATSTAGSMFPSIPSSSASGAKFSFNLSNNPFNPSSSSSQGAKGLNIMSNQPQQGSIFGQNVAAGGSNSNTGGLLQSAAASNPQQGSIFGQNVAAGGSNSNAGGLLQSAAASNPQQGSIFGQNVATGGSNSNAGGLLQSAAASNPQQGSIFGQNVATGGSNSNAGGLLQSAVASTPQQGSIFGQNVAAGGSNSNAGGLVRNAAATNPSGGLNFTLSAGNPQSGTFNFSAGGVVGAKPALGGLQMPQTQQQQSMMSLGGGAGAGAGAGNQSGFNFSAGTKLNPLGGQLQNAAATGGNIFGGSLASSSSGQTPFSFSANQQSSTKPTLFSGGLNGSQPVAAATQSALSFPAGLNLQSQQPSVFSAGPKQQSLFNFSGGMNSGQGQQQTQGFNFMAGSGSAPGQNQNPNQTGAFNFSAGGLGQQLQNTSAGMFGTNSQQSKLFGTGNGNQTQNQGVGFPTPQQTGFNFSASLGNQQQQTPGFNFSAGTPQGGPGAFNFSAGTPGTTPGRAVAKPRRRIKK